MLFDQPVKTRTRSQIRTHFWMKYISNVVNPISHSQSWRFVVGFATLPVYTSKCTYGCTRTMLPLNEPSVHRSADGWTSLCCGCSSRKRFCASSCRIWPIWRRSSWFKEPCRSHPRRFARGHSGAGSTRTSAKALQSHRTCKQPGTSLAPQYGQMSMGGSTARSLSKFKARSHHATTCYGKFMRRHITKTLPETFELIQRKGKAVVLSHFGVNAALGEPFGQAQLSPRHAQIAQTGVHNVHGDTKVTSSQPFLEAWSCSCPAKRPQLSRKSPDKGRGPLYLEPRLGSKVVPQEWRPQGPLKRIETQITGVAKAKNLFELRASTSFWKIFGFGGQVVEIEKGLAFRLAREPATNPLSPSGHRSQDGGSKPAFKFQSV